MTETAMHPLSASDLYQAFMVFDDASRQLAGSYHDLQEEVGRLGAELVAANARLRVQLAEKEALAERLAGLLSALPAGVLVLDEHGCVTQANATAVVFLGEPLLGQCWTALAAARLRRGDAPDEWLTVQGQRCLALSSQDLASGAGRIVVAADVTAHRAMEQALARSQRLATMGGMSASLAHQLRTPLATALLYASQLAQPGLPAAESARFAGAVVQRLRELESFIQGTLAFVQGRAEWADDMDLVRVMTAAQQVMVPQMQRAGVALTVETGVERLPLRTCREALLSMLLNLLDNALRACTHGGQVRLTLEAANAEAQLTVSDDGCGMDANALSRLFQPYFTTRSDGHGLGLAFVHSVVVAHGGRVAVESQPGRGTRVTVTLPVAENAREARGADERIPEQGAMA